MLSIQPQRDVYEIIVIDHLDERSLVPTRPVRELSTVRRGSRSRVALITATAATLCVGVGFSAGLLLGNVPTPKAPAAPPALSNTGSWLASSAPVRVEPLSVAASAAEAPHLAGWVAGSDIGGRGVKVQLLGTQGLLTTLAIELHAEPRMAVLRAVSSRAFDIEIGPVMGVVRDQELAAPDGAPFIRRVAIRKQVASSGGVVRVRVNLDAPGQGNLRVVGRTIYADFAARSAAS